MDLGVVEKWDFRNKWTYLAGRQNRRGPILENACNENVIGGVKERHYTK